jgi:hypothetical protein
MMCLARTIVLLAVIFGMTSSARAERKQRHVMVGAGIGMGELIHAEIGYFVTPRVLVEARGGVLIFNVMTGLAVTYSFGDREGQAPPRHGWLARGEVMVNPTLGDEFHIEERGETVGAIAAVYGGYSFISNGHFYFRGLAGMIIGKQQQDSYPEPAGPNFTVTLGAVF